MDKERKENRCNFFEGMQQDTPDVTYDSTLPFGAQITNKMQFGQRRPSKIANGPAPGQYEPSQRLTRRRSQNHSIGKAPRATDQHIVPRGKGKTPSMGDYNVMKPFGAECKKMSIGLKYRDAKRRDGPSPCEYDPSIKLVKPSQKNTKISEPQWVLI